MAETYTNFYWWDNHNPMYGGSEIPLQDDPNNMYLAYQGDPHLYYVVESEKANGDIGLKVGFFTQFKQEFNYESEVYTDYSYPTIDDSGRYKINTTTPIIWELKNLYTNEVLAKYKTTWYYSDVYSHQVESSGDPSKPYRHTIIYRSWHFSNVSVVVKQGTTKLNHWIQWGGEGGYGNLFNYLSLDAIPVIDSHPDSITDENNFALSYYNPAQANVEYCQIGILGSESQVLAQYRDVSPTDTSYTFILSAADKKNLQSYCNKANSANVYLAIRTKQSGMDEAIKTYKVTLNILNANPVINPTIIDTNTETISLTGNNAVLVRYHSDVNVTIGAAAVKETSLVSKSITYHGKTTGDVDSIAINKIEYNDFTFSAKDARGNTTIKTVTPTLLPYVKLTCNLSAGIPATDDTIPITVSGNYWRGNFGARTNGLAIQYRYKSNTLTEYSNWIVANVTPTYNENTYQVSFDISVPNHVDRYTVQARATDKLMVIDSREVTVQSYPIFDWSDTDFNFNVPVNVQNNLFISGSIYPGGDAMMDYVVEQGTKTTGSGNSQANWVYRKWNSGIAECWCRKHVSTAVNTAWGNLFVSGALSYTNITWGVSFTDIPVANITIAPNASGAFLIAGGSTSLTKTNTGGYEIARGSALASAGNFYINYYAIGTWK